jgi:hypothetical protein
MKKINFFCFIYWLTWHASFGQEAQVIELAPVEITPTDKILIFSIFSKNHRENKVNAFDLEYGKKLQ